MPQRPRPGGLRLRLRVRRRRRFRDRDEAEDREREEREEAEEAERDRRRPCALWERLDEGEGRRRLLWYLRVGVGGVSERGRRRWPANWNNTKSWDGGTHLGLRRWGRWLRLRDEETEEEPGEWELERRRMLPPLPPPPRPTPFVPLPPLRDDEPLEDLERPRRIMAPNALAAPGKGDDRAGCLWLGLCGCR